MPRINNLTFFIIALLSLIFSSVILYVNYKDIRDMGVKYCRLTAIVSSEETQKNNTHQHINLKYLDTEGKTHDIRYDRTPINSIKYKVGDSLTIWINKLDYEDIIIDGSLEDQNKIFWLIFSISLICLIGNLFWAQLKKILL